ncbi:MAG TPA: hypothetical protein VFV95_16780 [Vicinamibacterales bacterium]|nr:hypothetical protein [Vicinamibacterales bacterium]
MRRGLSCGLCVCGLIWLAAASVGGQSTARRTAPAAAAAAPTPRTPWGDPDLQGTWSSESSLSVPFERAREFGDRQWLTDAEFAARRAQGQRQLDTDNAEFNVETADISNAGQVGSATSPPPHWLERGALAPSRRTSLVIDPPNGRLPATTAEGQKRGLAGARGTFGGNTFTSPSDLSLWERCITRGVPGAIFPTVYNANMRIVQGPGVVAITYEMIHDTRVIHTDGRAHAGSGVRSYFGDSLGHWEGDTLVVDVTNFSEKSNYRGSRETLHLIERFSRVGSELRYEMTVDDPRTWSARWTAALNLEANPEGLFEYACHEGNYAMRNILSGSRPGDRSK